MLCIYQFTFGIPFSTGAVGSDVKLTIVEEVYPIMYRMGISMVVGALVAVSAVAQAQAQAGASSGTAAAATAQNGQANAGLASGTAFNAALSSPVDSKKCKTGDVVYARTTEAVK